MSGIGSELPDPTKQTVDPNRAIRRGRARAYPKQMGYFIGACVATVALWHVCTLLSAYIASRRRSTRIGTPPATRTRLKIRRLPLAIVNSFRAIAFRRTLTIGTLYTFTYSELFLAAGYTAALFTWSFINSTNLQGLKFDPKYWANVAGHVSAGQFALMTALGMKNNIISYATGISFDKLGYLHRMTARMLCLITWLHGAGRLMLGLEQLVTFDHIWVQLGVLASVAMTILGILGLGPIRDAAYEFFKINHFLFGVIAIISSYIHCEGLVFGYLMWPTIALWLFDWLLRGIRTVLSSPWFFSPLKGGTPLKASVDILSPHFLRIGLDKPTWFTWRPGQSVYVTFPGIAPLQAHPLTICTINVPQAQTSDSTARPRDIIFLVRVRNGFTRTLLNEVEKTGSNQPMDVLLDGPYSSPPLLLGYDTVLLIAGGSGVAFTLPLLLDTLNRAKKNLSVPTRAVFLWSIREADHAKWISESLLTALTGAASLDIDIRIFVTGDAATSDSRDSFDDDVVENEEKKISLTTSTEPKLFSSQFVTVQYTRPDLRKVIEQELSTTSGSISVNVCGTMALSAAVRSVLSAPRFLDVLRGGPTVNMHVEPFGARTV